LLYLTKSRGSLVGLIAALMAFLAVCGVRAGLRALRATRTRLIVTGICLGALIAAVPMLTEHVDQVSNTLSNDLDLRNSGRGLNSGLSGRTAAWSRTLEMLDDGSWIFGHGFRTGTVEVGDIDNGYLVNVFEEGIFITLLVVVQYCRALFWTTRLAIREHSRHNRLIAQCLCCLLVLFLTNNIVARYLFGYGNPFSVLAIFFVVSRATDFGRLASAAVMGTTSRTAGALKLVTQAS